MLLIQNRKEKLHLMTIKWIIFDAMGVIFEEGHDLHELVIPFLHERDHKISADKIENIYYEASKGDITSFDFWKMLGFGEQYPEIEKLYLDSCLSLDPTFTEIAKELRKKYKIGYLSNDVNEWSTYLRKKFNLNKLFDAILVSGEVGLRKPDPRIFEFLLKKTNSKGNECIFIDDNLKNLTAASEFDINTVRFIRRQKKTPFCSEFEISSFQELFCVIENFFT